MIRRRKRLYQSHSNGLSPDTSTKTKMTLKRKRNTVDVNSSTASLPSPKRRKRHVSFTGGDPLAPSEEEWKRMTPFQSFVVLDEDGQEHQFPVKRYALILPHGTRPGTSIPLRDYWVGKIKEIRSRNDDAANVWAKVQWLWSVHDILKEMISIDPKPYGDMERVLSNHFDFVAANCFEGLVDVESYVESDPEPAAISDRTFYYRSTFDIHTGVICSIPQPSCFCDQAYNANESGVMHFCPRKGCCRAYHASCLKRSGLVEKSREDIHKLRSQRALQFELMIPSTSDDDEDEDGSDSPVSGSIPPSVPLQFDVDRHREIPPELLALARSPMVKGIGTSLSEEWACVTGNLALVTRARRLVNEVLAHKDSRLLLKWRTRLEIPSEESVNDEGIDSDKVLAWAVEDTNFFLCPICKGVI